MSRTRINIKGTSDGLVVHIGSGDWDGLLTELASRLDQTPSFFKGGRVALHVGPRQLTQGQLEHIGDLLKAHQMSLWRVTGESDETQRVAASLGLETRLAAPQLAANALTAPHPAGAADGEAAPEEDRAILVRRTLRSGQSLRHSGHVIVIGDVNPGAEIIAGGDVLVWGRLRGTVHAGARGVDSAVVCALVLAPMQLRISGHIARSPGNEPDQQQANTIVPEVASVQGGQIVVEPWEMK
jgi:septum site-determining protein MinC